MTIYRKRCYDTFVNTHWNYTHSLSIEEYELFSKFTKKRFKNILPKDKSSEIVDIACGAGHFLYFLKKEGYKNIKGIDLSKEQLDIARKMGVNEVEQADLFKYLTQHPKAYEVIVANDIIEHFNKDEILNFLDLIHASLKPGGIAIISTINASSLFGSRMTYIDFTHELAFTPESLMQVMNVCGFKDVQVYGEVPVMYDFRSAVRAILWFLLKKIVNVYCIIERGTGRNLWKGLHILDSRIFAVGSREKK